MSFVVARMQAVIVLTTLQSVPSVMLGLNLAFTINELDIVRHSYVAETILSRTDGDVVV
jgi:hypothetical protein